MKKILILSLAFILILSFVFIWTGCKEGTAAEKEQVTLKVITFTDAVEALQADIKDFNEKYPWITITVDSAAPDQYGALITANQQMGAEGADIVFDHFSAAKAQISSLFYLDLTPYKQITSHYDINVLKANAGYKDGIYSTVTEPLCLFLIYNPKMLEDNGVNVPTNRTEFYQACDKFLAKGIIPMQFGFKDVWPWVCLQEGIDACMFQPEHPNFWRDVLEKGGTPFTDQVGYRNIQDEILKIWDSGYIDKNTLDMTYDGVMDNFIAGKFPFRIGETLEMGSIISKDPDFKFDFTLAPFYEDSNKPYAVRYFDQGVAINAKTKHLNEALLFLEHHITTPIYIEKLHSLPATIDLKLSPEELREINPNGEKILKLQDEATPMVPFHMYWKTDELNYASWEDLSGIVSGTMTKEQVLESLQSIFESMYPELFKK